MAESFFLYLERSLPDFYRRHNGTFDGKRIFTWWVMLCLPLKIVFSTQKSYSMYSSLDIHKDRINYVTSPFTHPHLFSAGYNDKGSFLFVILTLSAHRRGYFTTFGNVLECNR